MVSREFRLQMRATVSQPRRFTTTFPIIRAFCSSTFGRNTISHRNSRPSRGFWITGSANWKARCIPCASPITT